MNAGLLKGLGRGLSNAAQRWREIGVEDRELAQKEAAQEIQRLLALAQIENMRSNNTRAAEAEARAQRAEKRENLLTQVTNLPFDSVNISDDPELQKTVEEIFPTLLSKRSLPARSIGMPGIPSQDLTGPSQVFLNRLITPAERNARESTERQIAALLLQAERAAADRETRREIAQMNDATRRELGEVRNAIAQQKMAGSGGAQDVMGLARMAAENPTMLQGLTPTLTGQAVKAIANDPALKATYEAKRMEPLRASAQRIIQAIDKLIDPRTGQLTPGARGIYGVGPGRIRRWYPGSPEANAKAILDQITGNLTLNMLAEAKAQSRTGATGFGQLSNRELDVVESAASILKGEIDEGTALQELLNLRKNLSKMLLPGEGEVVPVRRDPKTGKLVRQ